MTIFVYKGLTRNPEIPRLSFVQYLQIGAKLPDVTTCQIYSFHDFWDIKGIPTGGGVKIPLPTSNQIRFNLR